MLNEQIITLTSGSLLPLGNQRSAANADWGNSKLRSSRRQFLGSLGALGATRLLERRLLSQSDEAPPNVLVGVRLEPFVDPLFLLPTAPMASLASGAQYCRLTLSEFRQKLHRDLPPTVVWGFEGVTPGPIIAARRDQSVTIDWQNQLPSRHRLLVDHTLDGAGSDVPEVRTTIHLHGGHVSAENDGYPEDWIVPGRTQTTVYPNQQPGATLWYHDHAMGITRLNAMMGLAGIYLLRDPEEERLALPSGRYDIPLVLQDRIVDARGQIAYPVSGNIEAPSVPEFFGTHILVNGRVSPYLDVEPRLYRFRFLNAANGRVFQLSLVPEQHLFQIGSDGGLLAEPVMRNELLIAPGERVDTVMDFRGREGRRLMLVNHGPAPYPSGGAPVPGLVMQFRVSRPLRQDVDKSRIPDVLAQIPRLQEAAAAQTRTLRLVEVMAGNGQPHRVLLDGKRFADPITEDPSSSSLEIWEFVNTTKDAHPIHLHTVHFQLLNRHRFDSRLQQQTSQLVLIGEAIPPPPEESGWKDTIPCPPGQVTRILVPFGAEPGRFVWHCHTPEHEDNEMMRPFLIRP
jgi:spore coat protein A